MATPVYDPVELSRFAEDKDLYGFQQLPDPPRDIRKADRIRREPNAAMQWVLAVLTLFLSSSIAGGACYFYATAVKGISAASFAEYAQTLTVGAQGREIEMSIFLGVNALTSILLYWVVVRITAQRPVYELTSPGWLKEFGAGLLLGVVLISIIIGVLYAMGYYKVEGTQIGLGILLALFIGIGPAFAEEVIYRGFALRLLDKAIGSIPAILLTSVVFGLVHASNKYVSLMQSLLLGISAGLLLGACYYLTRRLWLPIGLHLTWNFVQGGIFNSDVSGNGYTGGFLKGSFNGPEYLTGGKMGIEGSVISIGLTIVVGIIFLIWAHKRGHLNGRIGWNAPRINLLGSVPRIEIWAANGGWRPLPTVEELTYIMGPEEDEAVAMPTDDTPSVEPPVSKPTLKADAEPTIISEPSGDPFEQDVPDEVDALLPPEDAALTGELSETTDDDAEAAVSPEDKTEQFAPVTLDSEPTISPEVTEDQPDWPSDAEMEAVTVKAPDGPPTITKVSSSVTTVKGTGTGSLTDDDLDSTQQMDAVAEIDLTDQIKPIEQTKITKDNHDN